MGVELTAHEEIHILQIVREALANIERHAGALHAWVSLNWAGKQIRVTIEDDGLGIDAFPDKKQHYGLGIMRDRALSLNGLLTLERREAGGTKVSLQFTPVTPFAPCRNKEYLMSDQFSVVVIDDHPLFRKGVVQLLGLDARFYWWAKPPAAQKD